VLAGHKVEYGVTSPERYSIVQNLIIESSGLFA